MPELGQTESVRLAGEPRTLAIYISLLCLQRFLDSIL